MEFKKLEGLADLHNHTTASDGLLTPSELVYWAKKKGLSAIAITDHDSTDGIEEAIKTGRDIGVYVVPGIELNTQIGEKEIHILGYFIDKDQSWFQELLIKIRNARVDRAVKMVENLRKIYGFNIDYDEIQKESGGSTVGRPHIARLLVKKGIVASIEEAFEKYIAADSPAYVERYKITPAEGIKIIKKAGGVPVLAHPGLLYNNSLVAEIIFQGVLGIEAYHIKHTQQQSEQLVKLAQEYNLLITAGSDCHGELIDGEPTVGSVAIDAQVVKDLYDAANIFKQKFIFQ